MPISDKNLGKYKRPDIYIEEVDSSVIELPVQDVLINLVPGFSKKGPVNSPTQVTNKTDFIKIFGDIDKSLERKGSYFHRTCIKMLESGPIYALNLLSTDDDRDKLKWKTVSLATQFNNSVVRDMPYTAIFNKQDFWKRDAESFLDYTEVFAGAPDNDRLLHLTNVGDKTTTTFIYKSVAKGFDVSAEEWYGGATKVPAFIHPKDWVSDYMVTVVVLDGDWTNYSTLTTDSTLGKYFTTEGLVKGTIGDFLNERTVTVLAYNDVSLIPYFKDINNNNMYIKKVINDATSKTGLFCTFNEDVLLDSDTPTGTIDIIGASIVGTDAQDIEFLSYKENIVESVTYDIVNLNSVGNVFRNDSIAALENEYVAGTGRQSTAMNGFFSGLGTVSTGTTLTKITGVVNTGGVYYLHGFGYDTSTGTYNPSTVDNTDQQVEFVNDDVVYFTADFESITAYKKYYVTILSGSAGRAIALSETIGGSKLTFTAGYTTAQLATESLFAERIVITYNGMSSTNYFNINDAVNSISTSNNKIVLDPLELTIVNGSAVTSAERYDVLYLSNGSDSIKVLKGTQSTSTAALPSFDYSMTDNIILGYYKLAKRTVTSAPLSGNTALRNVIDMTYSYTSASNASAYRTFYEGVGFKVEEVTSGSDKYMKMTFTNTSGSTDNTNYIKLRCRALFTEFESNIASGKAVIINKLDGSKTAIDMGSVTITDYSLTSNASILIKMTNVTNFYTFTAGGTSATNYYKVLFYFIDNEFNVLSSSTNTNRLLTSTLPVNLLIGSGNTVGNAGVIGKYSQIYQDYYNGVINNWDTFYVNNDPLTTTKVFLKMWMQGSDMYVDFVSDETGVSPVAISEISTYNNELVVWSQTSNYKQTVEIETINSTLGMDKVYEISIDKVRYSEVLKGSFLEGYVSGTTSTDRKLVRVIQTVQDPNNALLKIVKTDGPINITSFSKVGSTDLEYSTTVYPQIDTYVSTYKGISIAPFKIHADSIPNKTESRQSAILDVVGKTTNLTKALANKNKISWRYMVDSFGLGLTSKSKQQLADLCGLKLNCLGFINMPSIKQMKKSDNPSFVKADGSFSTDFLKTGGDESKSPSFLYSFAEGVGAACVGYMIPYVQIDDDGTPMDFPPAAFAASTYMKKFLTTQSGIEPWTIPAGITNGKVTGIGDLEMDFNDDDLDNLSSMGANPIVKKLNNGFCINSEYTAKIFPYSSLSLMHARELLIELENEMYDMLLRYQWKFNTPEIRAEVKNKADNICKDLQKRSGIYDFRNVMDETNNTNYIIDLQMGVIDTYIEIIKGMGIIVNNITILKKGDIQSSGFR